VWLAEASRHHARAGLKTLDLTALYALFLPNEQCEERKELSYAALHYEELPMPISAKAETPNLKKQTPSPIAPKTSPPGLGVGLEKPAKPSLLKKAGKPRRSALFSAHTLAAS
jgi:hypothetical protein